MSIRVIAMDIDGTLTNSKKEITPRTKETLLKAQEQGILLILASGRPSHGLMRFAKELEMDRCRGLLVSYNGACVSDAQTGEILFSQTIPVPQVQAVLKHIKQFPKARPLVDHGEYMYVTNVYDQMISFQGRPFNVFEYESRSNGFKLCEVEDLSEFVDYPVSKILTTGDPEYLEAHYKEMSAPFSESLSCMFTGPFYYEYTARGVDKAKALDTVLEKLGFRAKEVIAFGDGQNDASMITYAGIGVAMGNAVRELKAAADETTLSNEEDGIAVALERMHVC